MFLAWASVRKAPGAVAELAALGWVPRSHHLLLLKVSHVADLLQTGHLTSGKKPSQLLISAPNKDVLGLCLPAGSHLDGLSVTPGPLLPYCRQSLSSSFAVPSTSSDSWAQRAGLLSGRSGNVSASLVVTREGAAETAPSRVQDSLCHRNHPTSFTEGSLSVYGAL